MLVIYTGSTAVEERAERDRWENPQQEQLKNGRGSGLRVGLGVGGSYYDKQNETKARNSPLVQHDFLSDYRHLKAQRLREGEEKRGREKGEQ